MTDHLVHTTQSMQPRNSKSNCLQHIYTIVRLRIESVGRFTVLMTKKRQSRGKDKKVDQKRTRFSWKWHSRLESNDTCYISQFKLSGNINQLDKSTFIFNQTTLTC